MDLVIFALIFLEILGFQAAPTPIERNYQPLSQPVLLSTRAAPTRECVHFYSIFNRAGESALRWSRSLRRTKARSAENKSLLRCRL